MERSHKKFHKKRRVAIGKIQKLNMFLLWIKEFDLSNSDYNAEYGNLDQHIARECYYAFESYVLGMKEIQLFLKQKDPKHFPEKILSNFFNKRN